MRPPKINDRKLLRLIDKEGKTQSQAARELGISRQAISKRLQELRGKTTQVIAMKKVEQVVDQKLDAMAQLTAINDHAVWLLDHVMKWIQGDPEAIQVLESSCRQVNVGTKSEPEFVTEYKFRDPHLIALQACGEIRNQIKLYFDISQSLFGLREVHAFQNDVIEILGQVDKGVRNEIVRRLNSRRSIRGAVRFT